MGCIPKPVVPDEIALQLAVWDVAAGVLVQVPLGKTKVDHVYGLFVGRQADNAVAQLDVAMEHPAVVHELQARDLGEEWYPGARRDRRRYSRLELQLSRRSADPWCPFHSADRGYPGSNLIDQWLDSPRRLAPPKRRDWAFRFLLATRGTDDAHIGWSGTRDAHIGSSVPPFGGCADG